MKVIIEPTYVDMILPAKTTAIRSDVNAFMSMRNTHGDELIDKSTSTQLFDRSRE